MKESVNTIKKIIDQFCSTHNSSEAMRFMLELDNLVYAISGGQSVRYGGGLHTKHRHINYHKFFVDNVGHTDSVIDLGCGIGVVANTIAKERPQATITGVDLKAKNINIANKRFKRGNLLFVESDILKMEFGGYYDVIIMSNVLEHIYDRVNFLKLIVRLVVNLNRILVRVPIFERDWRVPLKKELGVDFRLDSTHIVEFTQEEWFEEFRLSGLKVDKFKVCWGELWVVLLIAGVV
jgi:2-polyprenyl-3-methyl-5-hydroxy-6-metoxy-1,4-benzoquinol methylase